MRKAHRPMGRFFCLLMLMAAAPMLAWAQSSGPAMTQVVDTVYRADGVPAKGTVLISWPGFTTVDGKAVAAGSLSVQLGSGGAFAANLAPNTGAQPAGVYYKAVYQLVGQEPSTEYWVVPATGSINIGSVRAKLMPPTIAAQVLTRDVADTNYMHVVGDQTVSGVKTFATVNAQSINGAMNATAFPGSDIGAQVNAAIAACAGNNSGQQCEVRVPRGVFNHATTINLAAGVVLRCSGTETTTLNYTGNGAAINFAASGAQIHDCGLTLGTSALVGLDMGGHHGIADAVYLQGGGTGTTLIRVHSDVNMLSKVRESGILGTGIQVDHATDTYMTDVNIYGVPGNTTSQTLVVDTLTGGLQVENFAGGHAGRHGLVVRNVMGDHAAGGPTWLFFRNFIADCSAGGEGWLFDSSLGNAQLGATFLDSWAAGAGKDCTNNKVVTANAAGIRISGGRGIHIGGGSKIRANEGSGIVIDSTNAGNVQIEDSFIYGNNNQNTGAGQGIDVTAYVDGLSITGNTIGNYYYEPGYQQYGVKISPSGAQNLVIASNTFSGNTVGAILNPSSPAQYVQFGNTDSNASSSPNSIFLGDVAAYEKGSSYPAPWMVAQRGAPANYKFGYGLNCHWGGSGWQFDTDGANNGGACLFGEGSTGHVDLYTVPTNAPANGQTFTPAQLENFKRVHFDAAGAVQFFGNLITTGTLAAQGATFTGTTTVPTPVNPTDAANKGYVDSVAGSGGGGGDLSAPPAIGSVVPNTISATQYNNIVMADTQAGSDACAKVNTAIGKLQVTGGTVDARGFQGPQGCATTINVPGGVHLILPGATWTWSVSPGLNLIGSGAVIEGVFWQTVLKMNVANGIAIQDTNLLGHDIALRDFTLNGSSNTAAFGIFAPQGAGLRIENVIANGFYGVGIFDTAALPFLSGHSAASYNGGEGIVWGTDSKISGLVNSANNGSVGLHVFGGSVYMDFYEVDNNGHDGIYFDGLAAKNWTANTLITRPNFYQPAGGNPGNWNFYPIAIGTTGSSAPNWSAHYASGAIFNDGTMKWVAVAAAGDPALAGVGAAFAGSITGGLVDDNGMTETGGFVSDNIRIEGQSSGSQTANRLRLMGVLVSQEQQRTFATHGINVINAYNISLQGIQWAGSDCFGGNADQGGIIFTNVTQSEVNGFKSFCSTQNPVRLISSSFNQFHNIETYATNESKTSGAADSACFYIDPNSQANQITNLMCNDGDGGRGLYNLSTSTNNMVAGYFNGSSASPVENLGNTSIVADLSSNGSQHHMAPAGAEFDWQFSGTTKMYLDSSHFYLNKFAGGGDNRPLCSFTDGQVGNCQYYVSQYASIQAAIDAAYNNGTVQGGGVVIDDRSTAYSGPGFIVKDSVTLRLAATTYTITGTVTYNNGVGNVSAGIISMPGSHIVGAGTSTNHGTSVSAGAGMNADLIASSTVGTGTGANAQWWHWASIESLNLSGANQTSGRCLVVENMGETAQVENILARSCYGNNIEIIGSSATQSSIRNITTMRSQTASGMRFTNLAGVGKVDGLSGDCNPTALVSVQENAAGSLTILGLKAEGEASICTGQVHDPVVLLDGMAGFNDQVRIIGGYAFGTSQANFAKFINAGNAILETEGLYITGYTNMLNDTVRSVTVPLSSGTSKQPFYYEPGGTTYANQAFTLTGGTFVQGQPATTPTEIFGLTTGSATLLAAAGNGDNSSILTGGIQISGQNRTSYGSPPEIMARWGYRWLGAGLGYDTTNFDLVPAWNSGDASSRNLGNALNVCKKGSTTVSCRWPNIYALNVDTTSLTLNGSAVTIPTAGATTPNMDGTGAAGSAASFARSDHTHPSDTSRVATASINAFGSCGDSTHVCQVTTNTQGLVTNESAVAITAGSTNVPYWSNQVASGSAIAMSGTANKVYCYGIRIDQPITVTYVGMFVGTGDGTGNYSVQIFPLGSSQSPVFSSTAVHVSAAAGNEQQFSQMGNATWPATPGIYQLCTTGTAVTATIKGSASPTWSYYSQPSGLSSSSGLISGTLTSTIAPTFSYAVPTVVMH